MHTHRGQPTYPAVSRGFFAGFLRLPVLLLLAGGDRLLQSLGRGNSMTAALKSAFRLDLAGLDGIILDSL